MNAVYTYIINQFYGGGAQSKQVELELKSVAYNAINSYRSNLVLAGNGQYNGSQAAFIELLIGPSMTANTSPASVGDVLEDVENNIGISDLSVNEQTPLFMATVLGRAAYNYWSSKIPPAAANPWTPKFSTVAGQNYMNTLKWNVGAMSGALAGYGSSFEGLVEPNTNAVSNRMIAAVMGALTVTAGLVLFNWNPRVVKPLSLNVGNLHGNITNVTNDAIPTGWATWTCTMRTCFTCKNWTCNCTRGNCDIPTIGHDDGRFCPSNTGKQGDWCYGRG